MIEPKHHEFGVTHIVRAPIRRQQTNWLEGVFAERLQKVCGRHDLNTWIGLLELHNNLVRFLVSYPRSSILAVHRTLVYISRRRCLH
jgi:hypothetical protein